MYDGKQSFYARMGMRVAREISDEGWADRNSALNRISEMTESTLEAICDPGTPEKAYFDLFRCNSGAWVYSELETIMLEEMDYGDENPESLKWPWNATKVQTLLFKAHWQTLLRMLVTYPEHMDQIKARAAQIISHSYDTEGQL